MKGNERVNRIRQVREKAGLTRKAFGKSIGVTASAVANWEYGKAPGSESVSRIAETYGVSADWLTGGEEPSKTTSAPTKTTSNEDRLAQLEQTAGRILAAVDLILALHRHDTLRDQREKPGHV